MAHDTCFASGRNRIHQWKTTLEGSHKGLAISRGLPQQIHGLYHAGSVGIIMSGWLGAANYGAIASNKVDAHLRQLAEITV